MKKILIFMGRYLPGYKDGGPIRTISNLVEALGDEYKFYIVCLDRDHGDEKPYCNICYDKWNLVGKANVLYIKPKNFSFKLIKNISIDKDIIYLCGFFDDYGYKTLILNRLHKLHKVPVIVASMGSFSKGALKNKQFKKKIFIGICKFFGLFKNINWSVTSKYEMKDVQNNVGKKAKCVIAEDLPRTNIPGLLNNKKFDDYLKIVFISRISPQKNLLGAIKSLKNVKINIKFSIYGPLEDLDYWKKCELRLEKMPNNIKWKYFGKIEPEKVQETFQKNDIFLFPTNGENYGHVIFEALSAGCIPIISDQTPWQIIKEKKAGYVLELTENMENFTSAVENFYNLSNIEKFEMAKNSIEIAKDKVKKNKENTGYREIFN